MSENTQQERKIFRKQTKKRSFFLSLLILKISRIWYRLTVIFKNSSHSYTFVPGTAFIHNLVQPALLETMLSLYRADKQDTRSPLKLKQAHTFV